MDRSIETTRARILSLLARIPQGVPRGSLHSITGDTPLIHAALQELLDEGTVTERLITSVRGKPRREYILTANLPRLGLDDETPEPDTADAALLPGAKAIVAHVVQQHPGTTRSEMWNRAVVTKGWVSNALAALVKEGKIIETMEEDRRGGLIRRYFPADAKEDETQATSMRALG